MPKMKAAVVAKPGAAFEIQEREIPTPAPAQVRIRIQACGICFSDEATKDGLFPGIAYPRVPGHEVAGVVDETGAGVTVWKKGQRVGVGWNAGHDGTCDSCRRGDFALCINGKVSGVTYDGGYAEYWYDRSRRSSCAHPRIAQSDRCRPAPLRRNHNIQCSAQQWGTPWRFSRGIRNWRPRPVGSAICQ